MKGVPWLRDPAEELLWGSDKPQAPFPVRHRAPVRGSDGLEIFGGHLRPPNITVTISMVHILGRAPRFLPHWVCKSAAQFSARRIAPHKY